jgi:glycosyltransferase involved in cell wall biosynthesis
MRVAVDVRILQQALRNAPSGGLGGQGRYIQELVRALLARDDDIEYVLLVDRGPVPVDLIALVAGCDRVWLHGLGLPGPLRRLRYSRLRRLAERLELPACARQIRRARVDLVHLLDQPPLNVAGAVMTLYDLTPFVETTRTPKRALRRPPELHRLECAVKSARAVICISESTADDAKRLLDVSPTRLVVSYPGVDTTVFQPAGANGRRNGDAPSSYFLHVGVLWEHKNPEGLLRAFSDVATDHDVHLICAGPYQVAPQVEARVRELAIGLQVEERVHLQRACTDEQLAALYQEASGLVFPSFYEGFGLPIVEALACGTPCVASRSSSLPEVGGDLALFVDPTDHRAIASAMRRLLLDTQLRARVREQGPHWAARFSWDDAAETVTSLYERSVR